MQVNTYHNKEYNMLGKRYKDDGISLLKLNRLQLEMKKAIELKISENIYQFEEIVCPICQRNDFSRLASKDRYRLSMPVAICKACGLIQNNPRMNEVTVRSFYNNEYRKLYTSAESPTDQFFRDQRRGGERIYNFFLKHRKDKKPLSELRVLEVGCGAGGILHYFKEQGCQVMGIDLGLEYLEFGKSQYGLDLSAGTIFEINGDESFDLIIYSHVLEHVLSPNKELKHAQKLLADDGVMYIEVPGVKNIFKNYDMDFLKYLQNTHVYHFSLTTLNNLLKSNGYELVFGDEVVRSIYVKQDGQKSELSIINDYIAAIKYLRRLPFHPYQLINFPRRLAIRLLRLLGLYTFSRRLYRMIMGRV